MQNNLRPQTFKDYVGQDKIKKTLQVVINSALKRKKQLDHILLFGPSGMGKTTLAIIIAIQFKSNLKYAQGPLLEKKSDILALIGSINEGDVMFIDEIHGINKHIEELIYSILEDGYIDLTIGVDGNSKIVRLKIPQFTLIGATTKMHLLSEPLKDRFGISCKLKNYSIQDIQSIIKNSTINLGVKINDEAIKIIANHTNNNPRKANRILLRVIDFLTESSQKTINSKIVKETLDAIGIYKYGLEDSHIDYLKILSNSFNRKYASLENISSILKEDKINIEKFIESSLLKLGFVEKSSRGRKITNLGIKYLNNNNLL